jgi:hypothetical protein
MTDSTTPNGGTPEQADLDEADLDRSKNSKPGGDTPDSDQPAAPGHSEPLTDSTDGGLDGGDPGVEE